MKHAFPLALLVLCCLIGCNKPNYTNTEIKKLKFLGGKFEFEGLGMLSKALCQQVYGEHLFLADMENSRILQISPSFVGEAQIGRAGEGPGEFHGIEHFVVAQDKIYAYRLDNRMMNVFERSGAFIEQIPVVDAIVGRFAIHSGKIIFSNHESATPLYAYSLEGSKLKTFGKQLAGDDDLQRRMRSMRHVFSLEKSKAEPMLVAVSQSEPVLELYDGNETLVRSVNIRNLPMVDARMRESEAKYPEYKGVKALMLLFQDAYLDGEDLFLLLYSEDPPFHILRYKVQAQDIVFQQIYQVDEPAFFLSMATYNHGEAFYFYDMAMGGMKMYEVAEP